MKVFFAQSVSPARNVSLAFLAMCTASAAAFAQPVSVDPAQVEKRFEQNPATPAPRVPDVNIQVPMPAVTADQARLSEWHFELGSVSVRGSTVFSDEEMEPLYSGMIGQRMSMLDAQKIAQAITKKYRAQGYVLSEAKVASQNRGHLVINVREGYISSVNVSGDIRDSEWRKVTQDYADYLTSLRPVKNTDIERFILIMGDLPGADAKGAVVPTGSADGSAALSVTLTHKMFEGSYSVDNRGSKLIGPVQHTAVVAANSLLSMYDRTVVRGITTSPTQELMFADISHTQPVGGNGTMAGFAASYAKTEPHGSLASSDIEAKSHYAEINLSHPFLRTRKQSFTGRASVDMRDTDVETSGSTTSKDRIRAVRAGGTYDFSDTLSGANIFDAQISHGVNVLGASGQTDPVSRSGADNSFTKLNMDVARTQYLPLNGVSLFVAASAQYSKDPLLGAEQFSVGGATYGRAYNPTEISGDSGVAAKAELRYTEQPGYEYLTAYQLYGFYDVGRVSLRDTVDGANSLASAGVGTRVNFTPTIAGNLELAVPLTRDVRDEGDGARIMFGASAGF